MDTNVYDESTEYTEQTECLADVGHDADEFVSKRASKMKIIWMASVCSAIVIASRDAKDVMRKLVAMEKFFTK